MEENKELEKQNVFKEEKEKQANGGGQVVATTQSTSETKTAIGLEENIAGLLCYLFTFVSGIIFLLIEKENKFVRFHAMQSLIFFGGISSLVSLLGLFRLSVSLSVYLHFQLGWSLLYFSCIKLIRENNTNYQSLEIWQNNY